MFDVLVIGGGPAGLRAAHRAAQLGAKTGLIERGKLGGTAVNDGVAPTRTLARAARYLRDARQQFNEYGIRASEISIDFQALMRKTRNVVASLQRNHDFAGTLKSAGVEVIEGAGEARFTDANTVALKDGRKFSAKKFILCVGGRARAVQFPGSDLTLTHHDLWSLDRLPRSVIIVGGAATGCQVASILAQFGCAVTILETAPRLAAVEDADVSHLVMRVFEQRGIDVICGIEGVQKIERAGGQLELTFKVNGSEDSVPAEAVFVAAGWPGNADLLNLSAAGVDAERSYIKVNEYLQTSAAHIWSAGDANGRMMLTQCARIQGDIAAENAVRGNHRTYQPVLISHGSFTEPEYAGVGLTEEAARKQHECAVATIPYAQLDRAIIDGHTDGFFKLIVDRRTHAILGGHAVGEQSTDIVQAVAASIQAGETVEDLAALELAYPTYTSAISKAASLLTHQLGLSCESPADLPAASSNNAATQKESAYAEFAL